MENQEKEIDLLYLAREIWTARKSVFKYGIVGVLLGIIIALSIPSRYTTTALVAPEEQGGNLSGSMGMLGSMIGVSSVVGSGVSTAIYPDVIKSRNFILGFADIQVEDNDTNMPLSDYILDHQKEAWWSYLFGLPGIIVGAFNDSDTTSFSNSPKSQQHFVEEMVRSISVSQDNKTNIFNLSATFQNPFICKVVLDTLLVRLQEYMQAYHTVKTRATLQSNLAMLAEAKADYHKYDVAYANALDANALTTRKSYLVKTERLRTERDLALQLYRQVASQVGTTQLKLQEQQQIMTIIEPPVLPIDRSYPNRPLTVIIWFFLFSMIAAIRVVIRSMVHRY